MSEPIYRTLDEAGWTEQQAEIDHAQFGKRSWKPKVAQAGSPPAMNRIRLMPPHKNMVDPAGKPRAFIHVRVHFSLGPNKNIAAPCLRQWSQDCLACQRRDQMFNRVRAIGTTSDPAMLQEVADLKKSAGRIRPQDRFSTSIVDMQDSGKGVQPYHFGPELAKMFSACFYDDNGKFRDITHPKSGRDILFTAVKKPKQSAEQAVEFNDYPSCRPAEVPTPLQDEKWLEAIEDMSIFARRITPEDMRRVMEEGVRLDRGGEGVTTTTTTNPVLPAAPVQMPLPVSSTAAEAAPADIPKTKPPKGKKGRTPVTDTAPANGGDPWATGRAWVLAKGFATPKEVTLDGLEELKQKEPMKSGQLTCYQTEQNDPTDEYCQSCRVILPCATGALAAGKIK